MTIWRGDVFVEPQPESMTAAQICAKTGVSPRMFIRLREKGFVEIIPQSRGLGRPRDGEEKGALKRGTKKLEYSPVNIKRLKRFKELHLKFKELEECRWRLWCEGETVRIAPDLAKELRTLHAIAKKIVSEDVPANRSSRSHEINLEDITSKLIPLLKPAYMPRSDLTRLVFRNISEDDLRSVSMLLLSVVFGIKLPLYEERNVNAFQVFKRSFGLPEKWRLPANLFDVLPHVHEQFVNALETAANDELQIANEVCRDLERMLENPESWKRGAFVVLGAPLPWRLFKVAGMLWPSPFTRAITVALTILVIRAFRSWFEDVAGAVINAIRSAPAFPGEPES